MSQATPAAESSTVAKDPWPALFALCLGFFMILVDSTIVSVATPDIIVALHTNVNSVVWVTSAYLLAYAVPVLITGRLGDRFGQKQIYLIGLVVFTASSLWCGMTSSIEWLIIARVFQGFGAAMMTPQTMAIITRIFPAERRGRAMSLWGATAGVATLVGPILGGFLVDQFGWEWIFFINVPVGLIGFVLAYRLVPSLPTNSHKFDWIGVLLSGVGLFLIVFGIQEGHQYDWSTYKHGITIVEIVVAGVVIFGLFLVWEAVNKNEPLLPLSLFRDRNFSLGNIAISSMGCAITALSIPFMLYAQLVRGLSPTKAALLLVPMAVVTIALANLVGKLTDRVHPRVLTGIGFGTTSIAIFWLSHEMTATSATWQILLPMALLGVGSAFAWAPNSATTTRNLRGDQAGAGAGVYNATRQVGAVLGSAAIAVLIDSRLAANNLGASGSGETSVGQLPAAIRDQFSSAMSEAMLLPASVVLIGFIAALFFSRPKSVQPWAVPAAASTETA